MKIIIAPNAFKGSSTAQEVAESMSQGVLGVFPDAELLKLPIADGGDGTLGLILHAASGEAVAVDVLDPFGQSITAHLGVLKHERTAIIEMAEASGLRLVPSDSLNPMKTTTYGTGQLIKTALNRGCEKIVVGVGGSATVDGGIGMAQALGAKILDEQGEQVQYGGSGLGEVAQIDLTELDSRIQDTQIIVACDVENPLLGPDGAAPVFGPQKGATPEMVKILADHLSHFAEVMERDVGVDIRFLPSAGAAGGLAGGLVAFLGASIELGIDTILDLMDFDRHLVGADLVLTGEGQLDEQTLYGKAPIGVSKRAQKLGIPVIALAGGLGEGVDVVYEHGIDAMFSIVDCPMPLDKAMNNSAKLIQKTTERAMRLLRIGINQGEKK